MSYNVCEKWIYPEVSTRKKGLQKQIQEMLAKHNIHKKKVNSVPGNNARNCNEHSLQDNNENTGNDNKGNPDSLLNINCICQQWNTQPWFHVKCVMSWLHELLSRCCQSNKYSLLLSKLHIYNIYPVLLTTHRHQFDHKKWLLLAPDIPSQQDACSCSVYACINAVAFVQSPQLDG